MRFKRSKFSRERGNSSHGWGAKKKHRGGGHRGGRGMAGSGKRADQKKTMIWHFDYFGKYGFISKGKKKENAISILAIENMCDSMVKKGDAELKNGIYVIDLGKLGYDKLLSKGKAARKFKLTIAKATEGAAEKIKSCGGEVILTAGAKASKETAKPEKEAKPQKSAGAEKAQPKK
jgi:large subunit ribosomal protein L15